MTSLLPETAGATGDPANVAVRRRRLLGVGLRAELVSGIDLARDIGVRRTAQGVDLDLVEGVDALCQDLAIGLTTLRGSDPVNVRFGFLGLTPLVEQTSPVIAREALRSAVAELVASDPRVRRIVDLVVTPPGGRGGGQGTGRSLAVTVSFEAVSGDPVTVALGGMATGAPWGSLGPLQAGPGVGEDGT
jgi:hypothetical protein